MINESQINTLIALAEAHEGNMQLHLNGIAAIRTDDELNVYIDLENGQTISPEEVDQHALDDAIIQWRNTHAAFFQRIIGSMM